MSPSCEVCGRDIGLQRTWFCLTHLDRVNCRFVAQGGRENEMPVVWLCPAHAYRLHYDPRRALARWRKRAPIAIRWAVSACVLAVTVRAALHLYRPYTVGRTELSRSPEAVEADAAKVHETGGGAVARPRDPDPVGREERAGDTGDERRPEEAPATSVSKNPEASPKGYRWTDEFPAVAPTYPQVGLPFPAPPDQPSASESATSARRAVKPSSPARRPVPAVVRPAAPLSAGAAPGPVTATEAPQPSIPSPPSVAVRLRPNGGPQLLPVERRSDGTFR